jgi:hypothetical protein
VRKQYDGVVEILFSDNMGHRKCVCCPNGRHAFSRGVAYTGVDDTLDHAIDALVATNENNGKRVRVTVELLDDEE